MRLSGYVNTNYLFSMTKEEADEEQEKLYRLKHVIIHIFRNLEEKNDSNRLKHIIIHIFRNLEKIMATVIF